MTKFLNVPFLYFVCKQRKFDNGGLELTLKNQEQNYCSVRFVF